MVLNKINLVTWKFFGYLSSFDKKTLFVSTRNAKQNSAPPVAWRASISSQRATFSISASARVFLRLRERIML